MIQARLITPKADRFPFSAFPAGWFCVGFSRDVVPEGVVRRTLMGNEVVVYRTRSGQPVVMGAYCPHMGAHLGFGGRVVGERLRCPMHGFQFDTSGRCVRTSYGTKPPPTCRAFTWPATEVYGAVFAWHDPSGRAPWFHLPSMSEDGWTAMRTHCFSGLASHPQETTENSVDIGHFAAVHEYEDVRINEPLNVDGAHLTIGYHFVRRPLFAGAPRIAADIQIHVHGLGYSFVEVHVPAYGLRTRQLVLSTPTDGSHIDLRIGIRLRATWQAARMIPPWLLDRLLGGFALREYVNDVSQDYDIWANKRYLPAAALADGDGPIGKYRKWARQFYATGVNTEMEQPQPLSE